jgi:hypothetical protein
MIICYTLIDITSTGFVRKPKTPQDTKLRNQQRNYETFIQLISLRSQPSLITKPSLIENFDMSSYKFGDYFMTSIFPYHLWSFSFESEHMDSFSDGISPVGSLVNDFDNVPIIGQLNENAKINNKINTLGDNRNTYFEVF